MDRNDMILGNLLVCSDHSLICLVHTARFALLTLHRWLCTARSAQLASHCSLRTAHFALLTLHCSLRTTRSALLALHCLLRTARSTLLALHCLLCTLLALLACSAVLASHYLLRTARSALLAPHCLLHTTCSTLFALLVRSTAFIRLHTWPLNHSRAHASWVVVNEMNAWISYHFNTQCSALMTGCISCLWIGKLAVILDWSYRT